MRAPSQRARHERTRASAHRHGQPWKPEEDAELGACRTDDDLEDFAVRWGRRFAGVEQRARRPRLR